MRLGLLSELQPLRSAWKGDMLPPICPMATDSALLLVNAPSWAKERRSCEMVTVTDAEAIVGRVVATLAGMRPATVLGWYREDAWDSNVAVVACGPNIVSVDADLLRLADDVLGATTLLGHPETDLLEPVVMSRGGVVSGLLMPFAARPRRGLRCDHDPVCDRAYLRAE